jgi:hypothetical protein
MYLTITEDSIDLSPGGEVVLVQLLPKYMEMSWTKGSSLAIQELEQVISNE